MSEFTGKVPFFRPSIGPAEEVEVLEALRSGWLTTGPKTRRFEEEFADAVGARHAIALNSCTAALHLAVEALGLKSGAAVLVPTMTFAATAEVVRYLGAIPVLVDCESGTLNLSLADAERKLDALRGGRLPARVPADAAPVGVMPVHVGGLMLDPSALRAWARERGLWVVEDAAHAFPASFRASAGDPWTRCGANTADVTCFSFYANKTITTGEGGMAVTDDPALAERIRLMSLHGLSNDAWARYSGGRAWDYRILAPGFKYNLTDVAAAIGLPQLARAEEMRVERERIARAYADGLAGCEELELPPFPGDRIHAWHLFPVRLRLERLDVDRNAVVDALRDGGVGCSVHWRPLHLHPYYAETYGWRPEDFPVATREWERLVSLPLFPGMSEAETDHVVRTLRAVLARGRRAAARSER